MYRKLRAGLFIARCDAVGKIYNFKCDKVRVIAAWGKNCREESDIKFLPLAITL